MFAGHGVSLYPPAEIEGRLHELRLLYGTGFVDASGLEEALDLRTLEAVDEALQRRLHEIPVHVLGHRRDEIVRLAVRLGPLRDAAVEERLELAGDREVVDGRTEHDGVRPADLLDDRIGVVLDDALPELLAGVAAGTETDFLSLSRMTSALLPAAFTPLATSWHSAWELEFGRNDADMISTFFVFLTVFFAGIV